MSLLQNLFNVDVVKSWQLPIENYKEEAFSILFYEETPSQNTEEKTSNFFLSSLAHIIEIWDSRAPKACSSIATESEQAELTDSKEIISRYESFVRIWDCRKLSSPIDVKAYDTASETNKIPSLFLSIEHGFHA